jgi:hypothetical protein
MAPQDAVSTLYHIKTLCDRSMTHATIVELRMTYTGTTSTTGYKQLTYASNQLPV